MWNLHEPLHEPFSNIQDLIDEQNIMEDPPINDISRVDGTNVTLIDPDPSITVGSTLEIINKPGTGTDCVVDKSFYCRSKE